jgi:hypothetical protein
MGTSMPDTLSGWFIESCDCESLCPCWIDDEPDDNHCTGLFAWVVQDGSLGGVDVSGARIASVSTHNGRRRAPESGRYSILFIDVGAVQDGNAGFPALEGAFRAPEGGVLAELAEVNGVVLAARAARVEIEGEPGGPAAWCVRIRPIAQGDGAALDDFRALEAHGGLLAFAADGAGAAPLTLNHTALDKELAVVGDGVEALVASRFRVNLPSLPGGYVDRSNRSGMRGLFGYGRRQQAEEQPRREPARPGR